MGGKKKSSGESSVQELDESTKKKLEEEVLSAAEEVTPEDVSKAVEEGKGKAQSLLSSSTDRVVEMARQVMLLCELLYDWVRGDYKQCPWRSIATITAAVLYFVSPLDLIPDPIPVVGYLDDIVVVRLAIHLCRDDLIAYCKHRGIDPGEYGLS